MAEQHLSRAGGFPVIVAPTRLVLRFVAPLRILAGRWPVLTPANESRSRVGYGRPALIYTPTLKELELGLRHAAGDPVVVVEHPDHPWRSWADEAGATNIVECRPHTLARSAAHEALLARIDRTGDDGWADRRGRADLNRLLAEAHEHGWLQAQHILAYQLVKGRNNDLGALTRLARTIERRLGDPSGV